MLLIVLLYLFYLNFPHFCSAPSTKSPFSLSPCTCLQIHMYKELSIYFLQVFIHWFNSPSPVPFPWTAHARMYVYHSVIKIMASSKFYLWIITNICLHIYFSLYSTWCYSVSWMFAKKFTCHLSSLSLCMHMHIYHLRAGIYIIDVCQRNMHTWILFLREYI